MIRRGLPIIVLILAGSLWLRAGTIGGNVVIQPQLTRRSVAPPTGFYDPGAAVEATSARGESACS